jgi:SAM-dependent methyltransferase
MYNLMYRFGTPRWDTNVTPPEVRAVIEGEAALPAGRALDLGCGTGTNVMYLVQHGWEAVGVDFSPVALREARRKAGNLPGATFIEGDVTRLTELGVSGPFDFVLDIGCFHGLPADTRSAYAREVASVTRPRALFLIWAIAARASRVPGEPAMGPHEAADRLGGAFAVERVESGAGRWAANWHILRRK